MLEIMKRNKILTYAFLMAIPMTTGNIFSSCTDDFEKLNTSNIQVDPADPSFCRTMYRTDDLLLSSSAKYVPVLDQPDY